MYTNGGSAHLGNKPQNLKINNRQAIVNLLYQNGMMTITELSEQTGLSRTAATKIVNELVQDGILLSDGKREAGVGGGKRPNLYQINKDHKYVISLLISPSFIDCAVLNMRCKVLLRIRRTLSDFEQTDYTALLQRMSILIREAMQEMQLEPTDICAIPLLYKGIVNTQTGIVLFPIGTKWETGMPVRKDLSKILGFPATIFVENSNRFGGYAELIGKPDYLNENIVVISSYYGGLGGCVIDHGSLMRGVNGFVGEIGHVTVDPFSEVGCSCGNTGCFEALLEEKTILECARELISEYPDSPLVLELKKETVRDTEIFLAANMGADPLARRVVDRMALFTATAIHNVIMMLDPNRVILQGRFCLAGEYFLERLKEHITVFPNYRTAYPPILQCSEFTFLGDSGIEHTVGAAYYAIGQFLQGGEYTA